MGELAREGALDPVWHATVLPSATIMSLVIFILSKAARSDAK